jgi:hypothetical protein
MIAVVFIFYILLFLVGVALLPGDMLIKRHWILFGSAGRHEQLIWTPLIAPCLQ